MSADEAPPRLPLALTMGDPAGVGPDIAILAWLRRDSEGLTPFALYGDPGVIAARATSLGVSIEIAEIDSLTDAHRAFARALPVINVPVAADVAAGKPDSANAKAVIAAIDSAVAAVASGDAAAIVTNPIAKAVLYAAGFSHPGHTEYLAELASRHWRGQPHKPVMLLVAETADVTLRVVPMTIHVPLRAVPALVTSETIVETATTLAASLARDFAIGRPRIAIAGLNPHAGEGGAIGAEDRDIIAPAIAELRALGLDVSGPHSADAMFHAAARATYDAAIAMYHDQALIPIKTLAFDDGVNDTLGLPFIRTSPDHGTAFDIAGTGRASPSSLIAALKLADRMARRRAKTTAPP